ncbi:hydroxyisourate hydrolase [Sphingomonas profundi]|uniref:hydroxyisourate hydrolase n=1 Tax=Alterirhizorhabdus profundi TaxID=2681549 RepID=UPI0012E868F0|nr:hydroxyisourate hydrolase [Sphingomonas profundi]
MTSLSTHVLDLAHGCPAAGMAVRLLRDGATIAEGGTDGDGRWPALARVPVAAGRYALTFAVADYFRDRGVALPDPPFLDRVTIDFAMAGDGHYHVPLLVSPFGYSTYRGS